MNNNHVDLNESGEPGWVDLHTLTLHRDVEMIAPRGTYIRGTIHEQTQFIPQTDILGRIWGRPHTANLRPGWVELTNLATHLDMEAVAPIEPFVRGAFDPNDQFYPDEPFEIVGFVEPARPSKKEKGQKLLWYPIAEIIEPGMKTRGVYRNRYPLGAVVHYTAGRSLGGNADAINTIKYGRSQGHAYFTISDTGAVFQAHPLDQWGFHAGPSSWPGLGNGVTDNLVGIEVCCSGRLTKLDGDFYKSWYGLPLESHLVRYSANKDNIVEGYYHKYTEAQEHALIELLLWLKSNNPEVFSFDYVLGHDEVSPRRKMDPGASLSMTMPEFRELLKNRYQRAAVEP